MKSAKQQLKIQSFIFFIAVFSFSFFIFHLSEASAAVLYFDAPERVMVGETFEAIVMLDTEGESVNAVLGEVVVGDGETAQAAPAVIVSVRDGGSVVPLWVVRPSVENGRATFSGIIPGGFTGVAEAFETDLSPGRVVTLVFEAERAGTITMYFEQAEVLQNTETPSSAEITTLPLTLSIVESRGEGEDVRVNEAAERRGEHDDTEPPLSFEPIIFEDPAYFGGEPVILFNTTDADSGIAYYEFYSSRREISENGDDDIAWTRVTSPHTLTKADSGNFLYVKAVDYAGNERIAAISPQKSYRSAIFITILLVLFILSPLMFLHLRGRFRPVLKNKNVPGGEEG